jgi:hypothetical protein
MQVDKEIYNFFFHPLSNSHSTPVKFFATITVMALAIFSGFLFLVPFVYFNLRDRNIRLIVGPTKETKIKNAIFKESTEPKKEVPSKTSEISQKPKKPQTTVDRVKEKHTEFLKFFEKCAAENQWKQIHSAHYDWWMFPIDNKSGGKKNDYTVSADDINELKKDLQFMKNYQRGVELVVRAWGWELLDEKFVENRNAQQKWTRWDVRLGKMAESLKLFEQDEYHKKLGIFAQKAILENSYNLESWVLTHLAPREK